MLQSHLEKKEIDTPKIHNLGTLYAKVSDAIDLNSIGDDSFSTLKLLDKLYIDSRYPGEMGLLPNGKPTQTDAHDFYNFAKIIYNQCSAVIT